MTNKSLEVRLEQHEKRFEEVHRKISTIDRKLDMLLEAHHKQRGFMAGFSAAFSLLVGAVVALAAYIWRSLVSS